MRLSQSPEETTQNRRESREWDASKVPPSQFQRRKGSIYSTQGSRDGHVKGSERDQKYWEKLKEKVCFCLSFVFLDVGGMWLKECHALRVDLDDGC